MTALRPCPMKEGLPCCSHAPAVVADCGCAGCEHWQELRRWSATGIREVIA